MANLAFSQWGGKGRKAVAILLSLLQFANCQYYMENKTCAVFHSGPSLDGSQIILLAGDQSIDLPVDQRLFESGWNMTGSILVEGGCTLNYCNETYFDGLCREVKSGRVLDLNRPDIVSAKCECQKECKCSDIYMKKTTCARAYLKGGCRTCNTLYVDLEGEEDQFPEDFVGNVEAFRLRQGCALSLFSETDFDGEKEIIKRETVEDYSSTFHSYRCECDDSQFRPRIKPPRPASFPSLIDIPETLDGILKMRGERQYATHPGLESAYLTVKKKRSSKNAYILLLGSTGSGKSSAINLLFDNPNVTLTGNMASTTTDIHEFKIPVPIDELGVKNSELRVIDTPGMGDTRGLNQDAAFLTTLDTFLSNHEELKDRIPNVVLVFHKFSDNRFDGDGSAFVKMLRGLDTFREKITDENYSNVIFVLSHFCSETKSTQRRPDKRLAQFKSVIENYSLLPKPIIITVAENKAMDQDLPMVNGFFKLPNNEYYPRNLFEQMELVTQKGGDMIGLGVFRSAFRDSDDFKITASTYRLQKAGPKIEYYLGILTNAYFSIEKTEISQLLRQIWEEKLDPSLKRKFPASLPYLQKALSLRNVNTKDDIPKTTTGILTLLTRIKHDEASRELLKIALGIQAPNFPQNTIAGYSYNVFTDTYLPSSPFKLGDVQGSDIGFLIPKILTPKLEPASEQTFQVYDGKTQYVQHRLQGLGIGGTITDESFNGTLKPGHNIKGISFREDGSSLTALREFRLFDLVLNDKPDLSPEFVNAVQSLPALNENNQETVDKWNKFFNEYGTHVVKSVHGGGSIEIRLDSNKQHDDKLAQTLFDLVKFAEEMASFVDMESASPNGAKAVLSEEGVVHSLRFSGGDPSYHTNDLTKMSVENASRLLTNWKKSLKFNPVILTNEMQLVPISQIVKNLGQNYSTEIDRATSLLFNSELKYIPRKNEKPVGPGSARSDTPFMHEFLKMQAESNQRFVDVMTEMKNVLQVVESQRQDMEKNRLAWEERQKESDRMFQEAQIQLQREFQTAIQEKELEAQNQRKEMNQQRMEYEARQQDAERKFREAQLEMEQKLQNSNMDRVHQEELRRQETERLRMEWEARQTESERKFQQSQLEMKQQFENAIREKDRLSELERKDQELRRIATEAARDKGNKEVQEKHLLMQQQFIKALHDTTEQNKNERLAAQQQLLSQLENSRLEDKKRRDADQKRHQQQLDQMQSKSEQRYNNLVKSMPKSGGGGCLKTGSKILMADMTEKNVEVLQVGQLIMDKDLKPTRVLGVASEYLEQHKFYGFVNNSFFFTDSHLFVGPSKSGELKLYAQSLPEVYRYNPLMEYMDVSEMDATNGTRLFHLNHSEDSSGQTSLAERTFGLFKDPSSYPPDTPIYFVIVDSPTGTYFANGYVCRHDIPPFELWPNSMGLFFRLAETDTVQQFEDVPYELATISVMGSVTDQVAETVRSYMTQLDSRDWGTVEESQFPVMTLADVDLEGYISKIFANPTLSLMANSVYAKVGRIISPYLDSGSYGKPNVIGNRLGQVQHELFNIIHDELQKQLQLL